MDECELIVLISTLACAISKCCTDDELTLLSVVLTQLGDTLVTVITSRELADKRVNNNKMIEDSCGKADSNSINTI